MRFTISPFVAADFGFDFLDAKLIS